MNYQYTYDKMDNITTKSNEQGAFTYGYDSLYRLNDVKKDTLPTEAFTYDAVGNRLTSSTATNWTYNANNELLTTDNAQYEYDANGNTIKKSEAGSQETEYIYDVENRLIQVDIKLTPNASPFTIHYYYDPFGRRLWKDVSGVKTYFLYADEGLIGEYDSTGTEIKSYGYRPNSTWTTDPLFCHSRENGNPEYYFYHNDHLGTPQKMTTASGAIVWSATYTAFGQATMSNELITNNLRFPGQYYDQETGWHYNWFRYYDHTFGRYLTFDPAGIRGGDNHPYLYAKGNPLIGLDPNGLKVECINKLVSVNVGVPIRGPLGISGECGKGNLDCKDECNERKCYSYNYCCAGPGLSLSKMPPFSVVVAAEVGFWEGDDIGQFSGACIQLGAGAAVGSKGYSGSVSIGVGGGWGSGGVTAGPAVGIGAGVSLMGCWTWDVKTMPCIGPNPL